MEIKITKQSEVRSLVRFLRALVVNKSLFWSTHLGTNLSNLRRLGLQFWESKQGELKASTIAIKKSKRLPLEVAVATGQTKAQALFLSGDADIHMTGRGNVLQNINASPWVPNPSKGSPAWRKDTPLGKRPYLYLNGKYGFWKPGEYVDISNCNQEMWKSPPPEGLVTIKEAHSYLILSATKCNDILTRKMVNMGSWKKGHNKGAVSRWL